MLGIISKLWFVTIFNLELFHQVEITILGLFHAAENDDAETLIGYFDGIHVWILITLNILATPYSGFVQPFLVLYSLGHVVFNVFLHLYVLEG